MSGRKTPNAELKAAIFAELTASGTYRVIESSWIDEPYPFVHIGSIFGTSWDTKNEIGAELTVRFDLWSKVDSEEEVSAMMEWVGDKIGYSNDVTTDHLTLTNWDIVEQIQDSYESLPDIEATMPLRHGILDIRFVLEQK
jgi:hypothetical protein